MGNKFNCIVGLTLSIILFYLQNNRLIAQKADIISLLDSFYCHVRDTNKLVDHQYILKYNADTNYLWFSNKPIRCFDFTIVSNRKELKKYLRKHKEIWCIDFEGIALNNSDILSLHLVPKILRYKSIMEGVWPEVEWYIVLQNGNSRILKKREYYKLLEELEIDRL